MVYNAFVFLTFDSEKQIVFWEFRMAENTTLPIIPSYRLGLQSPWLIFKLWDWMLEWQCAKVTPSVKQDFEKEWNHGRLSKTGLERVQPHPPELHMLAIVFRNMFYGTSLLGIVVLKDVFVFPKIDRKAHVWTPVTA